MPCTSMPFICLQYSFLNTSSKSFRRCTKTKFVDETDKQNLMKCGQKKPTQTFGAFIN